MKISLTSIYVAILYLAFVSIGIGTGHRMNQIEQRLEALESREGDGSARGRDGGRSAVPTLTPIDESGPSPSTTPGRFLTSMTEALGPPDRIRADWHEWDLPDGKTLRFRIVDGVCKETDHGE